MLFYFEINALILLDPIQSPVLFLKAIDMNSPKGNNNNNLSYLIDYIPTNAQMEILLKLRPQDLLAMIQTNRSVLAIVRDKYFMNRYRDEYVIPRITSPGLNLSTLNEAIEELNLRRFLESAEWALPMEFDGIPPEEYYDFFD